VLASSFTASLEMTREGAIEMQQGAAFEPIFIRSRKLAARADHKTGPEPSGGGETGRG